MKTRQWLIPFALVVLVALAIAGLMWTRDSGQPAAAATTSDGKKAKRSPAPLPLVDERPLRTARSLSTLADTAEEQQILHDALKVGDHEVDLAFSDALRRATDNPPQLTEESKQLLARKSQAAAAVSADQERVKELTKKLAAAPEAKKDNLQDQLDVAQAQLELDQDELDDATEDVERSGADPQAKIERLRAQHEASHAEMLNPPPQGARADVNYQAGTLLGQFRAWNMLRGKLAQLEAARQETLDKIAYISARHNAFEQQVEQEKDQREAVKQQAAGFAQAGAAAQGKSSKDTAKSTLSSLKRYSQDQKYLSDLDRRIQDEQQLAQLYSEWMTLVEGHQRTALHGMLESVLWILLVLLCVYLADRVVDRTLAKITQESRRLATLRSMGHFVVQALGVALILFILFGVPNQMPTVLGLAGAGLTVALKDFIVGFVGWFVLMGRNGVRVGDWVEINGVVGEVVEVGLLRTVLLETGNWTDAGHPTGRKVSFVNSYAIEGHFFNFSTSGQWLWDELQINVPSSQDPYPIIDSIQRMVAAETAANAQAAEQEWQKTVGSYRPRTISAAPAINVRPTGSGVEVHVRYITRAGERFVTRARLYQKLVEVLHGKPQAEAAKG